MSTEDTLNHIRSNYILTRAYTGETEIADVTREDLAKLLHSLDFKSGAEIGVAAGQYGQILLKNNPQMQLYFIDPWVPYKGYKDYTRVATFTQLKEDATKRLDSPNAHIMQEFSLDALHHFDNESLDFVYIDANHRAPYVSQDIEGWAKKVRPGGIVSGHDYARVRSRNGQDSDNWVVIPAIQSYTATNNYELFIWGLNAKIPKLKRDDVRSWMFCK